MATSLRELASESRAFNSKIFSLPRILILSTLGEDPDITLYRDLKSGLRLNDGVLYANLNILSEMGYVKEETITLGNEKMTGYKITIEGKEELGKVKNWLTRWIGGGHGESGKNSVLPESVGNKTKS